MTVFLPTLKQPRNLVKQSIEDIANIINCYGQRIYIDSLNTREAAANFLRMDDHQSIDPKEMFFIDEQYLLIPHATTFQYYLFQDVKTIIEKLTSKDFVCYFSIAPTFRKDDSSRHSYYFHQLDLVIIYKKSSLQSMFDLIHTIVGQFISKEINLRVRSSYFPFTFPSYEVDMLINDAYMEILGCGAIHPKILAKVGLSDYYGYAAGMGVERLIFLKYGINNIKELFKT